MIREKCSHSLFFEKTHQSRIENLSFLWWLMWFYWKTNQQWGGWREGGYELQVKAKILWHLPQICFSKHHYGVDLAYSRQKCLLFKKSIQPVFKRWRNDMTTTMWSLWILGVALWMQQCAIIDYVILLSHNFHAQQETSRKLSTPHITWISKIITTNPHITNKTPKMNLTTRSPTSCQLAWIVG